jgi:hypothetical protein
VPAGDQFLVVVVLARQTRAQLLLHDQLIAPVGGVRDPLGLVHPQAHRLAALLAAVDQSHVTCLRTG